MAAALKAPVARAKRTRRWGCDKSAKVNKACEREKRLREGVAAAMTNGQQVEVGS